MDRWKSRGGKSQRREEQRREDQRRERVRRKKMQVREKVGMSRNTVFFQWFVAPEGRKVGSLKRRVRSHLARWEMKNCMPMWREAHFEVKMYKTHSKHTILGPLLEVEMSQERAPLWREAHLEAKCTKHIQNTPFSDHFGSCDVATVHAVVARSTFGSQMYKTHHSRTTFGKWDIAKVRAVLARSTFGSHNYKALQLWSTFGSWDVEKVHAVVVRSTVRSQKCKKLTGTEHFWTFRCRFAWQGQRIVHLVKSEQNVRVL